MIDLTLFSQRLDDAIKASGMKQIELADKIGVSQQTISSYVRAATTKKQPSLQNLVDIANALEVSLDWLLGMPERKQIQEQGAYTVGDLYRAVKRVEEIGNTAKHLDREPNGEVGEEREVVELTIYDREYYELLNSLEKIDDLRKQNIISWDMYDYIRGPLLEKADQTPLKEALPWER